MLTANHEQNFSENFSDKIEATGALDENQAGFRQGRSTADATQIFIRIQEDVKVVGNMEEISN